MKFAHPYRMSGALALCGLLATIALGGCANQQAAQSPSEAIFATASALTIAENAAAAYDNSPVADQAVKAQIKAADAKAYGIIEPLVHQAAQSPDAVTAVNAQLASDALAEFTQLLTAKGIH